MHRSGGRGRRRTRGVPAASATMLWLLCLGFLDACDGSSASDSCNTAIEPTIVALARQIKTPPSATLQPDNTPLCDESTGGSAVGKYFRAQAADQPQVIANLDRQFRTQGWTPDTEAHSFNRTTKHVTLHATVSRYDAEIVIAYIEDR